MFKIENPIDAYFLGWLYSDGGIHYSESAYSYCTKIKLKSLKEEKNIIDLFANTYNMTTFTDKESYGCRSYNRQFAKDLINIGVLQAKSKRNKENLKFPNIPKNLIPYFIRGVFEGDGSVYRIKNSLSITICGVTENFFKELILFFKSLQISCGISKNAKGIFNLKISNRPSCLNFINYVYKDNLNLILPRKYKKLNDFRLLTDKEISESFRNKVRKAIKEKHGKIKSKEEIDKNKQTKEENKSLSKSEKLRKRYTRRIEIFKDGTSLGIFNSAKTIEELSLKNTFDEYVVSVNKNGRNGKPFGFLKSTNIQNACNYNNLYKGLQFKYTSAWGQVKNRMN